MTDQNYCCPECGVPVSVRRTDALVLLPLHRDSSGKACPARGKSIVAYRYQELLRAIFGQRDG